ncbi:hypothetical protein [Roseomonas sp. AR75]|uniref:hypothetical protein n=1 Tax=Roseomonas sp. AR75 TaxID=2562311 RepID=UPI0010BFF1A5|nr:hypothetical protein [Roseomonas sp. AR75]
MQPRQLGPRPASDLRFKRYAPGLEFVQLALQAGRAQPVSNGIDQPREPAPYTIQLALLARQTGACLLERTPFRPDTRRNLRA